MKTMTKVLVRFIFDKIFWFLKLNVFHRRITAKLRKMLRSSGEKKKINYFCFNGVTGFKDCQKRQLTNPDFLLG